MSAPLIQPELSYKIVGCAFEVHNQLGGGHHEKYYQRALVNELKENKIDFKEQVYSPLKFKSQVVGKNYFDFLVNDQIVVEIKKGNGYSKRHIDQILEYLKTSNLPLAILINFGSESVNFKRIVNFDSANLPNNEKPTIITQ